MPTLQKHETFVNRDVFSKEIVEGNLRLLRYHWYYVAADQVTEGGRRQRRVGVAAGGTKSDHFPDFPANPWRESVEKVPGEAHHSRSRIPYRRLESWSNRKPFASIHYEMASISADVAKRCLQRR